jgi:hypothetical protein
MRATRRGYQCVYILVLYIYARLYVIGESVPIIQKRQNSGRIQLRPSQLLICIDRNTYTKSARNFCLKQPRKAFAFPYVNFENLKARGGIHYDCRLCRPKHVGRAL